MIKEIAKIDGGCREAFVAKRKVHNIRFRNVVDRYYSTVNVDYFFLNLLFASPYERMSSCVLAEICSFLPKPRSQE